MKSINIPILFFISIFVQIISCYLFLGEDLNLSYLLISGLCTITATCLAYSLVYYFSLNSGESKNNSEIKLGFTITFQLVISTFVIFLMILLKVESNYTTVLNPIILTIYGRQIVNKEIKHKIINNILLEILNCSKMNLTDMNCGLFLEKALMKKRSTFLQKIF